LLCTAIIAVQAVHADEVPPVKAQSLALNDAIEIALGHSPELRAAEHRMQALGATVQQTRARPNPALEAEVENFAGSGPLSGTDAAEYTVMVSQPFVLGGKRAHQTLLAELDGRLAQWTYESAKRDLVRSVGSAYAKVLEDQERVTLSIEWVRLSEELVETAERRVRSGGASVLEQTKAEIERAASIANRESTKQGLIASQRRLGTLLGLDSAESVSATGDLFRLNELPAFRDLKDQLPDNPDWARSSVEMEQKEAAAELAEAQRVPDLDLGVGFRRDEGAEANAWIVSAGFPLPLFDRNEGARRAAEFELAAAAEEQRAVELGLERELIGAYSNLSQAHSQAKAISETILPAAKKAFGVSREGYLQGRFGYLDLLDAQRTLFETRTRQVEALRMYHQAVADVQRLTAGRSGLTQDIPEE